MSLLEDKAIKGIGGGGFEHFNIAAGEKMKVPKGCIGMQAEPGKYTIIRPATGAQLESRQVKQDSRDLVFVYHVWPDGQEKQMCAGDVSLGVKFQHGK